MSVLLHEATQHLEVLLASGLGNDFMAECRAAVDEFEREGTAATRLRGRHIYASSEFRALAREGVQLVGVLDGLNAVRFREAPNLWAAWQSARRVERRHRRGESGEGVEEPVTGGP